MAVPTNRKQFIQNCLRRLGAPVLEINISQDQVEDRVDEALQYYWDYHFDGSDKQYYKYIIQPQNFPNNLSEVMVSNGGSGYSNTDTVSVYPTPDYAAFGNNITLSVTTDNYGAIVSVPIGNLYTNTNYSSVNNGNFTVDPSYTINTSTGSGAILQPLRGGYVPIPANINGIVNMFPVGNAMNSNSMFNIRYQIALNDLYTLTSVSMVPYYMAFQHIQFLEQILVGQQPIRYNRHKDRCYIDMDWANMMPGDFIVLEAYEIVDPNIYTKVWSDRWLQRYATCLIKENYATNLSKYKNMKLPGDVQFDATSLYQSAIEEKRLLETEIMNFSMPALDMIG